MTIKRTHGVGNVLLLLPVLEHLRDRGQSVCLLTRPEWVEALSGLVEGVAVEPFTGQGEGYSDLDAMTLSLKPTEHRTLELARLLQVKEHIPFRPYRVPAGWSKPFEKFAGTLVFAPEAQHPARQWPREYVRELAGLLTGAPLILTGEDPSDPMPCDYDLRGALTLTRMFGLLSQASAVITMDSGTLHMATSLGIPCVAIFGGVAPQFRVRRSQRVIALQAEMACTPCDKNETCRGAFPCLKALRPEHVIASLNSLGESSARGCEVRRIL